MHIFSPCFVSINNNSNNNNNNNNKMLRCCPYFHTSIVCSFLSAALTLKCRQTFSFYFINFILSEQRLMHMVGPSDLKEIITSTRRYLQFRFETISVTHWGIICRRQLFSLCGFNCSNSMGNQTQFIQFEPHCIKPFVNAFFFSLVAKRTQRLLKKKSFFFLDKRWTFEW